MRHAYSSSLRSPRNHSPMRAAMTLVVACSVFAACSSPGPASDNDGSDGNDGSVVDSAPTGELRTAHPRIYLTPERLDELRVSAPGDARFAAMLAYMQRRVDDPAQATGLLLDTHSFDLMSLAGFVSTIGRDPTYVATACDYVMQLAATPPSSEFADLLRTRNRLYALALGYDWMYADLTEAQRVTARDAIVAYVAALAGYVDDAQYVSGPSRWANVVTLAGAIAIHGDDARLDATLATTVGYWRDGYNPALADLGAGGGHQMAFYYGPAYSGVEAYLMWRTATVGSEAWVPDYLHDVPFFAAYATNGSAHLPVMEDAGAEHVPLGTRLQTAMASGIYGNAYAEAYWRELEAAEPFEPPGNVLRMITERDAPAPAPLADLPLTRLFPGAGFLITRDSWDRADATTLVFKASPFYSSGHHQRDEGSFVVDYHGQLLVDAGTYDGGGGADRDHYTNFYTRSVAHNTLLVQWPEEPLANIDGIKHDGGQEVRLTEAHDVAEMHGAYALHGMVGHAAAPACTWGRADLADTYAAGKLTSYTRDLLEVLRPDGAAHPAVLVVDRLTLPEPRPASVVWQFAQAATISGARIASSNAGDATGRGFIRLDTLRPVSPVFTTSSVDNGKQWTVNGVAHPPPAAAPWPYWGRIEVSTTPALATTWSTLLRIGDATLPADATTPIDLGGVDWVGARLGNTLFAAASPTTTAIALPAGAALVDGCVGGLAPGGEVDVTVGAGAPVHLTADADGLAVYAP